MAEVEYYVAEDTKHGFYDSCKDVQFGATNGFAMDLIGGGARNASAFLKYMGDYRPGLGSPFQISIPDTTRDDDDDDDVPATIQPLAYAPLDCADNDLAARCTCIDCPRVCPTLPDVPPPRGPHAPPSCTVGAVSCVTFTALILYSLVILGALVAYSWKLNVRRRQARYERLAMVDPPTPPAVAAGSPEAENGTNPFSHHNMASASPSDVPPRLQDDPPTNTRTDADASSHPSHSSRFRLGRGASLLDPIDQLQPRQNTLNVKLRAWFYRLGWACANHRGQSPPPAPPAPPLTRLFRARADSSSGWVALTLALAALAIALLNIGWKFFAVETDPVRLWVSPSSESAVQKAYFDDNFGPFYRPQQVFVMGLPVKDTAMTGTLPPPPSEVLSYDTLDWWLTHERAISALRSSPNNYTLADVCFAPAGAGTACVVQSVSAWLGTDMSQWERGDAWRERVQECADTPSGCLPDFGQPIDPRLVLGGTGDDAGDWVRAKSLVVTWVISNSLDPREVAKAEEWERALEAYLGGLARGPAREANVQLAYSTGVSLEQELNKVGPSRGFFFLWVSR